MIASKISTTYSMRQFFSTVILIVAIGLSIPAILEAQDQTFKSSKNSMLKVGIANRDITPDPLVKNWVTGDPYGEVRDPVQARVLVLGAKDQKAVIIHWELVDAGESATERVRDAVSKAIAVPRHNIIVNASHNHSAPWAPVYDDKHRGLEQDTWWAVRYMPPQNDDPHFNEWMQKLIDQTVEAAETADRRLEPVSVWIGRADVSEYVQNRRPRAQKNGISSSQMPDDYNYRHPEWDPNILSGTNSFGPVDRAMTVVSFRNQSGNDVATLFQLACHAVSIYPFEDAISSDWPGATTRILNEELEGQSMFLQGAAGDINPWRRGSEAVGEMAAGLAAYVQKAIQYSARLQPGELRTGRITVGLPLTDYGKQRTGLETIPAEIQAVTYGTLAIVTLPGEPMTELGLAIKKYSPFPQTLVLGYSNGNGVHYVGMPGEKKHGGYEVGEKTNIGTDRAGLIMVESAGDLLDQMYSDNDEVE